MDYQKQQRIYTSIKEAKHAQRKISRLIIYTKHQEDSRNGSLETNKQKKGATSLKKIPFTAVLLTTSKLLLRYEHPDFPRL